MWRCADFLPFHGYYGAGGLTGLLVWGLLVAGIAFAIHRLFRAAPKKDAARADRDDALDILKRRLAEGKISLEEYDRMKSVITG